MRRGACALGLGLLLALTACAPVRTRWIALRAEHPPLVDAPAADLAAVKGLRATSGAYRMIPLRWDPLLRGDAGGYQLERATAREGPFEPLPPIWGRGVIAYVDRGEPGAPLGDAATRFYRLRAFSSDGRLAASGSPVVVGTTAPLPDPPLGVRAYSRQPREVPLSWTPAENPLVAGYAVLRSPTADGRFERVAQLDGHFATSYVDAGLGDLRVFYYRVAARNPGGEAGTPSPPVRAVTKPKPLPPLGLHVAERRLGANVLGWEPNVETDLVAYRLYRLREGRAPELVASVPADARRARDGQVGAGELARYALVAVDRDGLESWPSEPVELPSEDYGLAAALRDGAVHLSWNPRPEEGFVRARLVRTGWLTRRRVVLAEAGEYSDRDAAPGRRYRYVAILERADGSLAPASQPLEVRVPKDLELR